MSEALAVNISANANAFDFTDPASPGTFAVSITGATLLVDQFQANATGSSFSSGFDAPSILVDGGLLDIVEFLDVFTLDDLTIELLNSGSIGGLNPNLFFDTSGLITITGDDTGLLEGGSISLGSSDIDLFGAFLSAGERRYSGQQRRRW